MHEGDSATTGLSLNVLGLGIELVGIIFAVFAVFVILKALGRVGGQVGLAFTLTLVGVIFQASALVYNIFIRELKTFAEPELNTPLGLLRSHNIHEVLMIIGIIFFVMAARQFAKLSQ